MHLNFKATLIHQKLLSEEKGRGSSLNRTTEFVAAKDSDSKTISLKILNTAASQKILRIKKETN